MGHTSRKLQRCKADEGRHRVHATLYIRSNWHTQEGAQTLTWSEATSGAIQKRNSGGRSLHQLASESDFQRKSSIFHFTFFIINGIICEFPFLRTRNEFPKGKWKRRG